MPSVTVPQLLKRPLQLVTATMQLPHWHMQSAEISCYVCIVISAVLYGIYFGVYYLSVSAIFYNPNFTRSQRVFYAFVSSLLLVLNTVVFFSILVFGMKVLVVKRAEFLGNPGGYLSESSGSVYLVIGSTSQNIAIFLSQALLIYRCYIVFGSRLRIIILPGLLAITTFAISMAPTGLNTNLISDLTSNIEEVLTSTGIVLSAIVDVIITAMISIKIIIAYYNVRKFVSPEVTKPYIKIIAVFVESAAPCAILGIICSVSILKFGQAIPWAAAAFLSWTVGMMLFPQLIILRVANGVAWTSTTSQDLSVSPRILSSQALHGNFDASNV